MKKIHVSDESVDLFFSLPTKLLTLLSKDESWSADSSLTRRGERFMEELTMGSNPFFSDSSSPASLLILFFRANSCPTDIGDVLSCPPLTGDILADPGLLQDSGLAKADFMWFSLIKFECFALLLLLVVSMWLDFTLVKALGPLLLITGGGHITGDKVSSWFIGTK